MERLNIALAPPSTESEPKKNLKILICLLIFCHIREFSKTFLLFGVNVSKTLCFWPILKYYFCEESESQTFLLQVEILLEVLFKIKFSRIP